MEKISDFQKFSIEKSTFQNIKGGFISESECTVTCSLSTNGSCGPDEIRNIYDDDNNLIGDMIKTRRC